MKFLRTGDEYTKTLSGAQNFVFNICKKTLTCPNSFAALYSDGNCTTLTTDNDDDITPQFYENYDTIEFNTTIIALNYMRTDANRTYSNLTLLLVCDKNYVSAPLIKVLINETSDPKYTVLFHHQNCKIRI